ncbi:hypothetical protein YC2023_010735 [Brassica napus]
MSAKLLVSKIILDNRHAATSASFDQDGSVIASMCSLDEIDLFDHTTEVETELEVHHRLELVLRIQPVHLCRGLNPNDLKLDDGNGSVRTLNGEEIEDDGLEHNMDQEDQIFLPTMHDEKSSQARMVVDLFQSEDGRHKSFTAQEEDADQI